MHRRNIVYLAVALVMLAVTWAFAAGHIIEEKSILTGVVTSENLVVVGKTVKEGDVLMSVETIAGPAAAVRATADGTVVEVLAKPGARIKTGDVVIKIEPQH
jgi:biotin carboxyl carrier protein